MLKGIPIGFQMAEKKLNRETDIFVFIIVEIFTVHVGRPIQRMDRHNTIYAFSKTSSFKEHTNYIDKVIKS